LYAQAEASKQAVAGVAEQVLVQLRRMSAVDAPVRVGYTVALVDPEATKIALDHVIVTGTVA